MSGTIRFLHTTLTGGFLVPIVLMAIILEKALHLAHHVVAPLAERLPREPVIGLRPAMLMAAGLLLVFCFLAGCFARTALARRFVAWLETTVLANLPGYGFFKSVAEGLLGVESTEARPVVLAHLDDAWQLGFLADQLDNGLVAVFVPDAPNPQTGAICYLRPENVTVTTLTSAQAFKLLRHLGAETNILLGQVAVAGEKALPRAT